MSTRVVPSDAARLLEDTEKAQLAASDPLASAWVSANAGAGKTHVLKTRVLRLLLDGTKPDRILCLTYTKSAAAEMAARVFNDLAGWATCDDATLAVRLGKVLGRESDVDEMAAARRLFARAIETPGGLKVQTIHAFCERLLQRFPLEAGVPPGFSILDDETVGELRREAINRVLGEAVQDRGSALGQALSTMIAFAAEDGFDEVLGRAIGERGWLEDVMHLGLREGDPFQAIEVHYREAFGVRPEIELDTLDDELASVVPDDFLVRAIAGLAEGSKRDQQFAERLAVAKAATSKGERIAALERALLTADKKPRSDKAFITKATSATHPDVAERLARARDRVGALVLERQGLVVAKATVALLRFGERVQQVYSESKARRAALDFDDLIVHTSHLLQGASAAEWVLYKLDGGLDHILVDEAQDTSPDQWSIVDFLAREFFAGSGAREDVRTLFAVGDEKQSIYSFQGAAPQMFAEAGARFKKLAEVAGMAWRIVPLRLSFRTVTPLLEAVDKVFSDPGKTPGLMASEGGIRHHALRIGQAGLLEVWPTETYEEVEQSDLWSPGEEAGAGSPVNRVARRIADCISNWLKNRERLVSENRPVVAGDILILVRRRNPFAGPMVAALKAAGIPVAGADRMMLGEQVVVQDLLALCDFLVLPEDDLALATVLKSPMFGFDDDDLLALAPQRKGMLWATLLGASRGDERLQAAADLLRRWRALADLRPPFEFLAGILDKDGMRERLLKRLGAEAIDPLDEFLSLSISFDDKATPSLTGFVDYVRKARRELKRDMEHGRNEVRVMTVHGAKGLEAPIVFLPDTCGAGAPSGGQDLVRIGDVDRYGEPLSMYAWTVRGAGRLGAIEAARARIGAREDEERNRLLYVAMTRARDRLYVTGFEGKRGRSKGCWYDLIVEALDQDLVAARCEDGREVRRFSVEQGVEAKVPEHEAAPFTDAVALPDWAGRAAPQETQITIPLAPSRLAPLEVDDTGDPVDPAPLGSGVPVDARGASPLTMSRDLRLLRGVITHALLEHLPGVAGEDQARAAQAFVALRGRGLRKAVQEDIVSEVMAVLREPRFSAVFGPEARAEVPVVAEIQRPAGDGGPPLRITGQIDRLLVRDEDILIVDYKTNRSPPVSKDDVAPAYLFQLAAYRLAVRQIFDTKSIKGAILWTEGPNIMAISDDCLDDYEQRLWQLDRVHLDALAEPT